MTREEYNDISAALDRIMKRVADDETLPQKAAIGAVGVLGGFQLFIKEYYEKHSTATPQGLDEAADEYIKNHFTLYPDGTTDRGQRYLAFKAGAKWMAEQGETFIAAVDYEDGAGYYIDSFEQEEEVCNKLGLKVMDKVIVQIRRKE